MRVEDIRLRSYASRIPEHPEWPKQAVSVDIPKVHSSFSDRGVEALIMWFTYWNVAWTALRESYETRDIVNEDSNKKKRKKKHKKKKKAKNIKIKSLKCPEKRKDAADTTSVKETKVDTEPAHKTAKKASQQQDSKSASVKKNRMSEERKKQLVRLLSKESDPKEKKHLNKLLSDIKKKEKSNDVAAKRAEVAMESREELIVDVQCRLVDIGIVVRSKKMKIFLKQVTAGIIADDKEDLKLIINDIKVRQTQWQVRKASNFHLHDLYLLDYLSLDHGDKKNESNFDALNEKSSQAAVPVVRLGKMMIVMRGWSFPCQRLVNYQRNTKERMKLLMYLCRICM